VRQPDGVIIEERRCTTRSLSIFLRRRPRSRVIVETCSEAFAIADKALELGHEVRVVPGSLVRSLGVGSRGVKNDRKDAQVLSEVSCRIRWWCGACRSNSGEIDRSRWSRSRARSPASCTRSGETAQSTKPTAPQRRRTSSNGSAKLSRDGDRRPFFETPDASASLDLVQKIATRRRTKTLAPTSANTRLRQLGTRIGTKQTDPAQENVAASHFILKW
jgi:hypothetical protein